MVGFEKCPSCNMSLRLFTPRECERHINDCLDAGTPEKGARPECAVCGKDLSPLTKAAQNEHANRCADSLLPKKTEPQRAAPRAPVRPRNGLGPLPQRSTPGLDPKVKSLLDALGLARYGPKFASEEIDLDAMRLLTDSDLSALRIPDAARRRIAEAMHSVALLNRIAGDPNSDERDSSSESENIPAPLTQQFQESRIANGVRRRDTNLVNLDSDDDDDDVLYGIYGTATIGSASDRTDKNELPDVSAEKNIPIGEEEVSRDRSKTVLGNNSCKDNSVENNGEVLSAGECGDGNSNLNESVQLCSPPIEHIPNGSGLFPVSRDYSSPSHCGSSETNRTMPEDSPRTMSELEEWRAEANREELQRHKRKLDAIDEKYRRLKRKLEATPAKHMENVAAKKSRQVVSHSPIDLTLDDTPVKANVQPPVLTLTEKTPPSDGTAEHATEAEDRLRKFQSQIIEDSSSSGSSSDNDFNTTLFSNRVANVLNQRLGASCRNACKDVATHALFENEKLLENQNSNKVSPVLQEETSQSCDEVMDLTQVRPEQDAIENRYVPNMDDCNTRESCSGVPFCGDVISAPLSLAAGSAGRASTAPVSTASACTARPPVSASTAPNVSAVTQTNIGRTRAKKSRLRKPKKVTASDLRCAIRADPKLLDDMLLMKSVELDRVMASVKSFGLKVSHKALVEFMFAEGLPFKEAPEVNKNEKSKQYFVSLCTEGFY